MPYAKAAAWLEQSDTRFETGAGYQQNRKIPNRFYMGLARILEES